MAAYETMTTSVAAGLVQRAPDRRRRGRPSCRRAPRRRPRRRVGQRRAWRAAAARVVVDVDVPRRVVSESRSGRGRCTRRGRRRPRREPGQRLPDAREARRTGPSASHAALPCRPSWPGGRTGWPPGMPSAARARHSSTTTSGLIWKHPGIAPISGRTPSPRAHEQRRHEIVGAQAGLTDRDGGWRRIGGVDAVGSVGNGIVGSPSVLRFTTARARGPGPPPAPKSSSRWANLQPAATAVSVIGDRGLTWSLNTSRPSTDATRAGAEGARRRGSPTPRRGSDTPLQGPRGPRVPRWSSAASSCARGSPPRLPARGRSAAPARRRRPSPAAGTISSIPSTLVTAICQAEPHESGVGHNRDVAVPGVKPGDARGDVATQVAHGHVGSSREHLRAATQR